MLDIDKSLIYKAFGLNILSEIYFPELPQQIDIKEDNVDIRIVKQDLSKLWDQLSSLQGKLIVSKNMVMFQIPDIATFLIQDGKTISFSPLKGYDEDIIRIYLLGTCMGSLLMQRKVYPLHGSAVVIDGKAYAFVGESGAGKSTLALTFLNHGYQLLSDDVIAVSLSDDGVPYVIPSYPQQKLWQESLNNFGMESENYKSIYGRENKFCVPVTSSYFSNPVPLVSIFELRKTEQNKVDINCVEKLKRIQVLNNHTYRNYLIPKLDLMEWHFNTSVSILKHIDVFELQRPASSFSAPQLASLILETINKGELTYG